jgi:predicted PurR-regulated permease PerM
VSESAPRERDYLAKSVDIAIRLTLLAIVFAATVTILGPFLPTLVWASVIAIALYPAYMKLTGAVGGRRKLSGGLFILLTLAAILTPTIWLGDSLLDGTVRIVRSAGEGTLNIPPPTEQVRDWPVIGDKIWALWSSAHQDLAGTIEKLQPQIGRIGNSIVRSVGGLGKAIVQTLLALVIAGVLMISTPNFEAGLRIVARRMGGETGVRMLENSTSTVRSVVKGVILVAIIQGLAAAVGLRIAGVPAAGLWAFLVLCVAVIQLPPLLILGPIAAWVFANNDSVPLAVFFLVWSVIVSGSDGFLKPLLLGRGTFVPMLVVLIGAIGGMLGAGVLGLFIGPVVLAIAWELGVMWTDESREPRTATPD